VNRSAQEYDPLGALGSRPLAIFIGSASVAWAALASLFSRDVPGSPTLSTLTVLLVAGASGVLVVGSSPFRAPFTRGAFAVLCGLLGLATVLSVAAQWGPDRLALNDFMVLVTAACVLVAAPYRPWRDVLVGGIGLAVVDGLSWGVAAAVFPNHVPAPVVALIAAAPTLVITTGAVVFSSTFVGLAERVQIRAGSYSVERAERDGIAASVQQDRVTILARDVAPFFEELRGRDAITDADRERARQISDGIRRVMVADADRTWLDQALLAEDAAAATVEDPDALIRGMDADQRTVVRTFLRAVLRASTVDPAGVRIVVERPTDPTSRRVGMLVEVAVADSDVGIHRAFDAYFAVLRVTFPDLDVAVRPSSLALRFSYDQH
jgi:hypothetical protein